MRDREKSLQDEMLVSYFIDGGGKYLILRMRRANRMENSRYKFLNKIKF